MSDRSFDDTTKELYSSGHTSQQLESHHTEFTVHERDDIDICRDAILSVPLVGHASSDESPSQLDSKKTHRFDGIRFLGAGGFGVVFAAFDQSLEIHVAIKLLRPSRVSSVARQRFLEEAKITAGLHHPNIVRMYDSGVIRDIPFISSSFVDGGSLADLVLKSPKGLSPRDVADIGCQIADAVAYAHSKATFHRDLKPSNVLIQADGSDQHRYRATLSDFGLAKRWDREMDHGFTQEGEVPGTVRYMSPEQAKGDADDFSVQSEVFSLGIILYQMATGSVPFEGTKNSDIRNQIVSQRPKRPSAIVASFPRELESIILKCLEKNPSHRYDTVADLAKDLRRYLLAEPVQASRPSQWRLAVWYARTHPFTTTLVISTFLTLFISASLISYAFWNQRTATKKEFKTKVDYVILFGSLIDDVVAGKKDQQLAMLDALYAFRENLLSDLKSNPNNDQLQHLLSLIHHYESIVYQRKGDYTKTVESRIESVAILKGLRFHQPKIAKYRFQYIYGIVNLALSMDSAAQSSSDPKSRMQQRLGIRDSQEVASSCWPEIEQFAEEFPDNKTYLNACNQFKIDLAQRFLMNQPEQWLRIKEEVIADSISLADRYPDEPDFIKPALTAVRNQSSKSIENGNLADAMAQMLRSDRLFEQYLKIHFELRWVKVYYLEMKTWHALCLMEGMHFEQLALVCRECLPICEQLSQYQENSMICALTSLQLRTMQLLCEYVIPPAENVNELQKQLLFAIESPETPTIALKTYSRWMERVCVPPEISITLERQLALRQAAK